MKKTIASLLLLCALAISTGCATGPFRLSRSWDDYRNQKYTESSWVHGVLLSEIIPVYPIVGLFAGIGDVLFLNTWYFWTKDAWDNHGTGFTHDQVDGAARTVDGM